MNSLQKLILPLALCISTVSVSAQNVISGTVVDSLDVPVIGAAVTVEGTTSGAAADLNGVFRITGLKNATYTLRATMIGYKTLLIENVKPSQTPLRIVLEAENETIDEIVVKAVRMMNNEAGVMQSVKESKMVVNGVASRSIAKTQDRDAGEVVRRIPGISIVDNKYIVSRGLSQRYNNVWINGASVPSSEADSRAFSFDMIPAGQIENIMIVKSPVPELPADFTGGFVKINTKDVPEKQPFSVTYSIGVNTVSHFNDFRSNKATVAEMLGFGGDKRMVEGGMGAEYDNDNAAYVTHMTRDGFNNDWSIRSRRPSPDQKLTLTFGKSYQLPEAGQLTVNGALNFSRSSLSYLDMENSRYGVYNKSEDKPEYLYKYTDNQYTSTLKAGALLNMSYIRGNNRYYLRNILNIIGQNKLTERSGWQNISSLYNQQKTEYNYSSRTTYSGQLSGVHDDNRNRIDWALGYSYADKDQPDRRIINRQQNDLWGDTRYGQMRIDQNDIERNFVKLNEHIASLSADYTRTVGDNNELRTGVFADYRTRNYRNRAFYYRFDESNMPEEFAYGSVIDEIMTDGNFGADKLYIYDDTDNRDNYDGQNGSVAAYAAMSIKAGRWNIYAGARYEYNRMRLTSYTRTNEWTTRDKDYTYADIFPSANISLDLTDRQLIRAAYGMSTNRPEFRELSSSVYYDFDLFSDVKGNPDLKAAYIHNLDLRYEWYPSSTETVSAALFYKHFTDPIETTFLDAGGSYTYTFENASQADAFGVEIEARKNLDFVGLPQIDLTFNGALIDSKVRFAKSSTEHNRPMQGQSPYLINAGIYYKSPSGDFNLGILYNRIGKRIVGIGKTDISVGGSIDNDIPDMYEMPRNAIDLVAGMKLGENCEVKLNVKDLLSEDALFCQFPKYTDSTGRVAERRQVTKRFNAGRNITLSASIKF